MSHRLTADYSLYVVIYLLSVVSPTHLFSSSTPDGYLSIQRVIAVLMF